MDNVLYYAGHYICHQNPARSLTISGRALPVCARCAGLYTGIFISAVIYLAITASHKKARIITGGGDRISLPVIIFSVLGIIVLAFDVAAASLGLYKDTALFRLITGFAAGYSLPLYTAYANGMPFPTKKELAVILAALCVTCAAVYSGFPGFYTVSLIIFSGVLILWLGIALTLFRLITK